MHIVGSIFIETRSYEPESEVKLNPRVLERIREQVSFPLQLNTLEQLTPNQAKLYAAELPNTTILSRYPDGSVLATYYDSGQKEVFHKFFQKVNEDLFREKEGSPTLSLRDISRIIP